MPLIEVNNVTKIYNNEFKTPIHALKDININIEKGELISIIGSSGAGKTTLLSIIAGFLQPTKGWVNIDENNIHSLQNKELVEFRRNKIGYVWQLPEHNLISGISLMENIMVPMKLANKSLEEQKKNALEILKILGIENRKKHKPNQVSGGEAQRASIAVAIANNPILLLGDQITGELDSHVSQEIVSYIINLNNELGTTIIVATHSKEFIGKTHRSFEIKDGLISNTFKHKKSIEEEFRT